MCKQGEKKQWYANVIMWLLGKLKVSFNSNNIMDSMNNQKHKDAILNLLCPGYLKELEKWKTFELLAD